VNYVEPHRDPSPGVLVAAIVLLLYAVGVVIGGVKLFALVFRLHPGQNMLMLRAVTFPVLRLAAIEIGLLATSWGIFRLRPWARWSILSIGTGMVGVGAYLWISVYLGLPNHGLVARTPILDSPLGLAFSGFLLLFVTGAWWILFFTRPSVAGQFTRASAISSGTSDGETHQTSHF
jgi:hypothetical protein